MDGFAHFVEAALKSGDAVVMITTESHRANIIQRLGADGVDLALKREQIIFLDVADSLSTFTVDVQCGCIVGMHDSEQDTTIVERIRAEHSAVYSH